MNEWETIPNGNREIIWFNTETGETKYCFLTYKDGTPLPDGWERWPSNEIDSYKPFYYRYTDLDGGSILVWKEPSRSPHTLHRRDRGFETIKPITLDRFVKSEKEPKKPKTILDLTKSFVYDKHILRHLPPHKKMFLDLATTAVARSITDKELFHAEESNAENEADDRWYEEYEPFDKYDDPDFSLDLDENYYF